MFVRDDDQLKDIGDNQGKQNATDAVRKNVAKKEREKTNAMKLFLKKKGDVVSKVTIKDFLRLELAMDYVGIGMSFRQTAAAIQRAKDRTKTAKLADINDGVVGQYTRVLVAFAFQEIADILEDESVLAMSLAGDERTHGGQSFFDLRVRVCYRGELVNLHLFAIPKFERHSARNIFNLISKFMDALYAKWRDKLIGMSSDGEKTMTVCHSGVVTRIFAYTANDVLRIWCAPHQIDIVVKAAAEGIQKGIYVKQAYTF
jgi:hypothetical protein